jgi:molybdenum cofactor synthesis domain-containing protein
MRASGALLPGQPFEPAALLAPAQAIVAYRARVALEPVGVERVGLDAAFDRILARDVVADARYPAHPRSTMDGFAIRSADGLAPRRIVGEVRMGHPPPAALGAGESMRIPTGGAVPEGADTVVPVEDADEADGFVRLREAPEPGDAITPAGEDMEPGDRILPAGRRIDGAAMGVLATLGCTEVDVWRRPTVAIVSTGDELVDPERRPGPGQVRDSNRFALAGALRRLGAEPLHVPRAADESEALEATIRESLRSADAVLLTGGSSVGIRDLVPRVIDRIGEPGVIVHGLRVRPGRPTALAAIGSKPVIGLPGNPTSALMIFLNVAVPILRGLTGEVPRPSAPRLARAGAAIRGKPGWTWFLPVRIVADGARPGVVPLGIHSSHTSLLARADGFIVIPEDHTEIAEGEPVEVHGFDEREPWGS